MILQKELNLIKNQDVRKGVERIVNENEMWISSYPPSISGKHHKHEPVMVIHLQRTVFFAEMLSREFNVSEEERDIIIGAAILHDIGSVRITKRGMIGGPGWKYYPKSDWSRIGDGNLHPLYGSIVIGERPFRNSSRISDLVMVHMGFWYRRSCPVPRKDDLLAWILCTSDYLASRDRIVIKEG